MMSLRSAPHRTTGISPAMMLFGREISLPSTLVRGLPPRSTPTPTRLQYPAWLRDRLHRLHHQVRDRVNLITIQRKDRYDVRANNPKFQAGDLVWLFDPKRKSKRNTKLQSPWAGPYLIKTMVNDVIAEVQLHGNPSAKLRRVHVNRLAQCPVRNRRE